ncbi:hypothetical protein M514_11165 [Trichuris suis]|uniref:Small ribosomal subunit protein uS12m n=1 Tax=Trichuris suis TaxID=68888 RepID=A0A085N8A9_9BILA|nr:hypothetical protein M514_11165 [Trichuris suis]
MSIPICTCRGVLGNLVNRLFSSPFSGPLGQSVRWKNLFEMHMRGGRPERRPQPKSPISGHPQMRGVVLKVLIKKPKKPNSANRKCVLVRLTNGKETVAWIPGEGHNLQEHSQVLVEGGRKPDLIGAHSIHMLVRHFFSCYPCLRIVLRPSNTHKRWWRLKAAYAIRFDRNGLLRKTIRTLSVPKSSKKLDSDSSQRERLFTIPNLLCSARIAVSPLLGYWVVCGDYGPALALFSLAGATDVLDGLIARYVPGQGTILGTLIDPLADKILLSTLFITLTYVHLIPVPLTVLVLSRDIALIFASIFIRLKSIPAESKSWRTFFDITKPVANTFLQIGLVCTTLATLVWNIECSHLLRTLWYLTAATTVGSGIGYTFSKTALRKLNDENRSAH